MDEIMTMLGPLKEWGIQAVFRLIYSREVDLHLKNFTVVGLIYSLGREVDLHLRGGSEREDLAFVKQYFRFYHTRH